MPPPNGSDSPSSLSSTRTPHVIGRSLLQHSGSPLEQSAYVFNEAAEKTILDFRKVQAFVAKIDLQSKKVARKEILEGAREVIKIAKTRIRPLVESRRIFDKEAKEKIKVLEDLDKRC
ncbi:hypothetical protein BCR34DRAFT_552788 [Clohesyomyces aquaticus]|uniref:Uncharacterized protein n=1 Tax=Clohesyomyces aquaticus TaxID=1231657 RepID=A0A1Y2A9U8_9PLEO|nr:hypothetical protein BCR34DRAFT_552788 [Clohesyomyces aquaticus]